ncbi:MAG: hypothetical protein JWO86_4632 [Myxococcaceae bacterium]|nr:hypothetical protein [Myxococcaceae bacterium]
MVSATRFVTFVFGATWVAFVATSTGVGCKNGEYDGSFDGSADGASGAAFSRVVQPDKTEIIASTDGAFDVTFGPGTFAKPTTITITTAGERTLDTGLIVPIYAVSADQQPAKFFQVSFHGSDNLSGGQQDRALVPALSTAAGVFTPLAIDGTPNGSTGSQTFWGLGQTFGTYSLAYITGIQSHGFPDTPTSCTGQCCHPMNGNQQLVGFGGGCFCTGEPDFACFLQHCSDLAGPAARCAAIGAANNVGSVDCKPFGVGNCPGPGCPSYSGFCGNGGAGGTNNFSTCCITNKNSGSCVNNTTCSGFSARCTANTNCPANTKCCVFDTESYCAADCPAAQVACASSADCTDAGADGGTCSGGGCPVAVCGTPPGLCK